MADRRRGAGWVRAMKALSAVALWMALWLSPLRVALERDMAVHMTVQLPLLACVGVLLAAALRPRVPPLRLLATRPANGRRLDADRHRHWAWSAMVSRRFRRRAVRPTGAPAPAQASSRASGAGT